MSSAPDANGLTERLLRRERVIMISAIVLLAALGLLWTVTGAGMSAGGPEITAMDSMPSMVATAPPGWLTALMWAAMMVAMMLPSAAPTILLYGRVRASRGGDAALAPPGAFLLGYLLVWLAFSLAAAGLQDVATRAGWLDPTTMRAVNPRVGGAALILIGLYQLSPFKNACLTRCRSPAIFIARHWRPGAAGALRLGVLHGGYCFGCCGLLMILLFVGGVMNFAWIAAIAALVAAEKLLPWGRRVSQAAGVALIVWGAARVLLAS